VVPNEAGRRPSRRKHAGARGGDRRIPPRFNPLPYSGLSARGHT